MIRCPRCGTELPDGVSFCDHCGAPVRGQMPQANPVFQPFDNQTAQGVATSVPVAPMATPSASTCPVCGAAVIPGEAFCDNCGAALLAAIPGATAPPVYPAGPGASAPPVYPSGPPVQAPPIASAPPVYSPPPVVSTPVTARLVVVSSRAEVPLPQRDDLIVGREDAQSNSYPDVDLNPHGALEQGVSRRHARITRRGNQYYVEDLNSTNGTLVGQRRIPPHTPTPISDGDQLIIGRLGLVFEQ